MNKNLAYLRSLGDAEARKMNYNEGNPLPSGYIVGKTGIDSDIIPGLTPGAHSPPTENKELRSRRQHRKPAAKVQSIFSGNV